MTLEKFLETKPMTQAAFADLVGVKQATINRYIRSERFPSPEMIRKIEEATNFKVKVMDWFPKGVKKQDQAA